MGGALARPVPHLVWTLLPTLPQGALPTEPNRGGAQVLHPSRSRLGYPGVDCRAKRVGAGESQEDRGVQDPQASRPQHLPHFYNALKFTTKEMWEEFTGWFAAQRRNK